MSPRHFVQPGRHEGFKGLFHFAGAVLCATMATYNGVAWCYRRDRHLRWNALVYSLAAVWEVEQTIRHVKDRT